MTTENGDLKPNTDENGKPINPEGNLDPNKGKETPAGGGGEPKPNKGNPPAERVVPNEYNLSLPQDSVLDEERVSEVKAFAKAQKLTNDDAQAILERDNAFKAAIIEGQKGELEEEQKAWVEASKVDSEIGGEKYNENVELAKRVIDKVGTPAFKKALVETGLGDHPELIRFCARMGKHLKDDNFVLSGTAPTETKKSTADLFYGDSDKNKKKE